MPSDTTPRTTLATDLRRLGLNRTADELNDRIAEAARKRWSATVLLEHIVADELEDKHRRSVESRLTRARLGRFKPLADWDWEWPTALDRTALERILTLDFLARGENAILVGAQGLGKTMLAKNIAHQAVLAGHTALFTTAADLLLDLNGQETARALERRLRHYTRPTLLVIDELGYLSYDARAADLIFQLVSRRYEHRSLLITTNLPFKRWDTVFPNASCAVALIDRLTPPCRDPSRGRPELSPTRSRAQSTGAQPPATGSRRRTAMTEIHHVINDTLDGRAEKRVFTRSPTYRGALREDAGPVVSGLVQRGELRHLDRPRPCGYLVRRALRGLLLPVLRVSVGVSSSAVEQIHRLGRERLRSGHDSFLLDRLLASPGGRSVTGDSGPRIQFVCAALLKRLLELLLMPIPEDHNRWQGGDEITPEEMATIKELARTIRIEPEAAIVH